MLGDPRLLETLAVAYFARSRQPGCRYLYPAVRSSKVGDFGDEHFLLLKSRTEAPQIEAENLSQHDKPYHHLMKVSPCC
jgi:hypothetical protein